MGTIGELVRRTLPFGTRPTEVGRRLNKAAADSNWHKIPIYPTDVFAVVAQLMEQSGAYHHIRSLESKSPPEGRPNLSLELNEQKQCIDWGRAWSLTLPFISDRSDKILVLWGAREWLKSAARFGHDPLWFYRYRLRPSMIREVEHHLDDLNANATLEEGRFGQIRREALDRCFKEISIYERGGDHLKHKLTDELESIDEILLSVDERDLQAEWETIMGAASERVLVMRSEAATEATPRWWRAALKLLIASDEACIRLGTLAGEYFDVFRLAGARAGVSAYLQETQHRQTRTYDRTINIDHAIDLIYGPLPTAAGGKRSDDSGRRTQRLETWQEAGFGVKMPWVTDEDEDARRIFFDELRSISFTFSGISDYDHVCVFPKSRVPSGGSTIRNLTSNLALLPSRGIARANFRRGEERPFRRNKELNLLLVPFPFRLSASAFVDCGPAHPDQRAASWRWFDLKQVWLDHLAEDHIASAIDILCRAARTEVDEIDAIVLPEAALSYAEYAKLALHISRNHPSIELLIAGTSERPDRKKIGERIEERHNADAARNYARPFNEYAIRLSALAQVDEKDLRKGNFVGTTTFLRYGNEDVSTYLMTFQQKHHRWRLDKHQIRRYGIWRSLDPRHDWWENLETATRNVEFTTFRGGSTLVALVCEDLARLEPCQELIRAVGPNLVVALLLDGPQTVDRWSARYATVLADDPGSSVLCLTSLGLLARSTQRGSVDSRNVGLWKDDSGLTQEIHLPAGAHAAVLRLEGERRTEHTIDGRDNAGLAISWRYKGCVPIHDTSLSRNLPPEFLGKVT